jgi:predicted MFS family arabinose efflux permease
MGWCFRRPTFCIGALDAVRNPFKGRPHGPRYMILAVPGQVVVNMALSSWTDATRLSAVIALATWFLLSCCVQAPRQGRSTTMLPETAPVAFRLYNARSYLGVTVAGIVAAAGLKILGARQVSLIGMALVLLALAIGEISTWWANDRDTGGARLVAT